MYEETIIHLATAYLNTNYISVEDICNCLWYGPSDTKHNGKILKTMEEALTPMRETRFEDYIDKWERTEDDLELAAKLVTKRIEQICSNIYRKRWL